MDWNKVLGWNQDVIHALRCTGFAFLKEGKYEQAKIYFQGLLTLDPHNLYDLRTLSSLLVYLRDAKSALPLIDRALILGGYDYATLLNRAKALFLMGRISEALETTQELRNCPDKEIADDAYALYLAYR